MLIAPLLCGSFGIAWRNILNLMDVQSIKDLPSFASLLARNYTPNPILIIKLHLVLSFEVSPRNFGRMIIGSCRGASVDEVGLEEEPRCGSSPARGHRTLGIQFRIEWVSRLKKNMLAAYYLGSWSPTRICRGLGIRQLNGSTSEPAITKVTMTRCLGSHNTADEPKRFRLLKGIPVPISWSTISECSSAHKITDILQSLKQCSHIFGRNRETAKL